MRWSKAEERNGRLVRRVQNSMVRWQRRIHQNDRVHPRGPLREPASEYGLPTARVEQHNLAHEPHSDANDAQDTLPHSGCDVESEAK